MILVIGGIGLVILYFIQGERTVPANAVNLASPLRNGTYTVVNSGKNCTAAGCVHDTPGEIYALDIVNSQDASRIDNLFFKTLESYVTFGETLYSPCYGNIKDLQNDALDHNIGIGVKTAGGANYIIIGCDQFTVLMSHLKQGSIIVKAGDIVQIGQELGKVGNSGNTTGPHLHIIAYREQGEDKIPLPITINGQYFYSGDSFSANANSN